MAWGIFNKIRDGAVKAYNTVVPIAQKTTEVIGKVVDYAKPLLKGTKAGDIMDKIEKINETGKKVVKKTTDFSDMVGFNSNKVVPSKQKYVKRRMEDLEFDDEDI